MITIPINNTYLSGSVSVFENSEKAAFHLFSTETEQQIKVNEKQHQAIKGILELVYQHHYSGINVTSKAYGFALGVSFVGVLSNK